MNDLLHHITVMILPLLVSNVLHMYLVKKDSFSFLKIPLSKKAFGKNKTLRGFLVLPLINALILYVFNKVFQLELKQALLLGFVLGLAYMAFELPNSFIKRRLGIEPGSSHPRYATLFKFIDKTDSAFGVSLTYFLLGYTNIAQAFLLFLISCLTHILFSQLLYLLHIKKSF